MIIGLANRCNWLQVYSLPIYFMVYQISKVCIAFMYMQNRHRIYDKLHIHHELVLDQSASDNAYSSPLRHGVWNVEQKMIMLGIGLCYNNFSHICVQHQNYLEHDTVCLSILFPWIFFCILPDQWHHFREWYFVRCCWNYLVKLKSLFWLLMCIWIW